MAKYFFKNKLQRSQKFNERCKMKIILKLPQKAWQKNIFFINCHKKMKSISKALGLTQEELAFLLGVTRSQLSMYQLGKRNLPPEAKLKLSELLQAVTNTNTSKQNKIALEKNPTTTKWIAELLLVNQQKQLATEKRLQQLQRKIEKEKVATQLMNFLKREEKFKTSKVVKAIALKNTSNNSEEILLKLTLKLEVLQAEEKILKKYL